MEKYIAIALIALLAAGCSGCKRAEKNGNSRQGQNTTAAKSQLNPNAPMNPVVPAEKGAPPSSLGTIEGTINLEHFKGAKGNLFLYIIDNSKMPNEVSLIAASIYPAQTIKSQKSGFIMRNVPTGTWTIIAVWDTAPPFCKITNLYCAASVKDGLGESPTITTKPGQTVSGVNIDIF